MGCIYYHALAGAPPFPGPSPMAVVVRHAVEAPRPLRNIRPNVPATLERWIARLLAKDADARFTTPAAAAAALHPEPAAALTFAGAAAPPPPTPIATAVLVATPVVAVHAATAPVPPAAAPDLSVDLATPGDELAQIAAALSPTASASSPAASRWRDRLLGALGLLAAQVIGGMLAYLLHAILHMTKG